ncbi:TPA: replication/maintenance protein RepL [Enterococcus faecalis]
MRKESLISPETEARVRQQELAEQEKAEKRAKKNFNFVQIEKRSLRLVRELYDQNATAGKLLFILAEKMNNQNALVCSYETMSKITGLGRTALYKAIRYLKDNNWIQVIKVGTANAYVINSRVFWQSYGDKKMTVFHATIIASSDEQEEPVENWDKVTLKNFPFLSHDEDVIVKDEQLPPPDQLEMDYHK